ncbi:MAG: PH domain-containing protein, partial [Deltaproteobacteria bacterium]|nr:PH domain-containing protein [Deltaproteobacteria bacterium]
MVQQRASTQSPQTAYPQQPPGFTAGVFPREHLIPGEIVLWEARPAVIAYVLGSIVAAVIGLIILLIFIYSPLIVFGIIFLVLGSIGTIINYIRAMRTSFALTNRRVLTQYGVFSTRFADCPHDKIQNSAVIRPFFQTILGYGTLMFSTAAWSGGIASRSRSKMMGAHGGVYWFGLRDPAEVKRYAEEVIEITKRQAKAQDYEMMAEVMDA